MLYCSCHWDGTGSWILLCSRQGYISYKVYAMASYNLDTSVTRALITFMVHDDVIKWKHFLRNWPFVQGIHRSLVNSPYKGQWRGALMFSLICVWINGWVNNRKAGDLRCYHVQYDLIVMSSIRRVNSHAAWVTQEMLSAFWIIQKILILIYRWYYVDQPTFCLKSVR